MKKTGFTLIELLVLIAILAVAMGIGVILGGIKEQAVLRKEMVRRGVAHYEIVGNGKVKCVWNTPEVTTITVTNDVVK